MSRYALVSASRRRTATGRRSTCSAGGYGSRTGEAASGRGARQHHPHRASASRSTVGCPPSTCRIGRRRVDGSATTQRTRSQVMVGSWSSSRLPRGRDVGGEVAVSASKVLHEGVSGGDRLYGAGGALPTHGLYGVRELATIGHDRIVVHNAATGSRKAHRVAIIIGRLTATSRGDSISGEAHWLLAFLEFFSTCVGDVGAGFPQVGVQEREGPHDVGVTRSSGSPTPPAPTKSDALIVWERRRGPAHRQAA